MELQKKLKILDLSTKEEKVLRALSTGITTPLGIFAVTKISRVSVYAIFQKLKKRGLAETYIIEGKKKWRLADARTLNEKLYEAKKVLLGLQDGRQEIEHGTVDSLVVFHRGKEAIRALLFELFTKHKNERFFMMQGTTMTQGWKNVVTTEEINTLNESIKNNNLISEAIFPKNWFPHQYESWGKSWAEEFMGRAAATYEIEEKFFNHAGQIFMFGEAVYLVAMNELIIIEIKHSEIQKMIKGMFGAIEEGARKIDVNQVLKELIEKDARLSK